MSSTDRQRRRALPILHLNIGKNDLRHNSTAPQLGAPIYHPFQKTNQPDALTILPNPKSALATWSLKEHRSLQPFFDRPNRHTAIWTGPHDSRALNYAQAHNISPFFVPSSPSGKIYPLLDIFGKPIGTQTDVAFLHHCNEASNKETEACFETDQELGTGDDIWVFGGPYEWYLCTRGQKLRTVREWMGFYLNLGDKVLEMVMVDEELRGVAEGEGEGMSGDGDEDEEELKRDVGRCAWMVDSFRKLEGMVLSEVVDGWDWRVGLEKQCEWRVWQTIEVNGFSSRVAEIGVALATILGLV